MRPSSPLTLYAPAKINLTLEVLGRRDDGYHGVRSVIVPLALADEIAIEHAAHVTFRCDDPALDGADNLALRALRAVESATGASIRARVTLRKRVPAQAGLGGGSSDAAAILLAAAEGSLGAIPPFDALGIARELGSDVPFFLVQTAALVEGAGERVTALGATPAWSVLLVRPPVVISTAKAYAALDERARETRPRNESVSLRCVEALQRADFDAVNDLLSNDFTDVAMEQAPIRKAALALRDAGAPHPLLAGSGSCVFALARDVAARDTIASRVRLPSDFAIVPTEFARAHAWRP
jgi:4-diphosphocytidyl-2-C-methyl-D-erythritol kinase